MKINGYNVHKIRGVPLEVCAAEQKIAYDLSFRYESWAFESAADAAEKIIGYYRTSYTYMPRYNDAAIFAALYSGFLRYQDKHFVALNYDQIGAAFPLVRDVPADCPAFDWAAEQERRKAETERAEKAHHEYLCELARKYGLNLPDAMITDAVIIAYELKHPECKKPRICGVITPKKPKEKVKFMSPDAIERFFNSSEPVFG